MTSGREMINFFIQQVHFHLFIQILIAVHLFRLFGSNFLKKKWKHLKKNTPARAVLILDYIRYQTQF